MRNVIFCDAGSSKIQIWADKDIFGEVTHVRNVKRYAKKLAEDMIDYSTRVFKDSEYDKVWDILNTFEAAGEDGQKWYDFEYTFWDELVEFFFQ